MIPIYEPEIGAQEKLYVNQAIDTGWISSQGSFVKDFEKSFADWHSIKFGVAVANCTVGLHLSLMAIGLKPGDKVLCPNLTFISPANMIRLAGFELGLVDIEPTSWAMCPSDLEQKICPRTKAIVVVHPFGHPAAMDKIKRICNQASIKIIEDVAEAPGARTQGELVGSIGDISCFSFFGNKILTTGEGGMVLTSCEETSRKLKILRDHGMSPEERYKHLYLGFNYRMTNLQAAVGLGQFERFEEILKKRHLQAECYEGLLQHKSNVTWRPFEDSVEPVHWLATVTFDTNEQREKFIPKAHHAGVETRRMIYPVSDAEHFKTNFDTSNFPVSRDISYRSCHLPSGSNLSREQIELICDLID